MNSRAWPLRVGTAFIAVLSWAISAGSLGGHDVITTKITWNTDIARIVFARCAGCHRPDGPAFSLLTYEKARPWAVAIKEEVLTRRMPPWGAVSGFGSFRNAMDLSIEEIERFVAWTDGGVPEAPEPDVEGSAPVAPPSVPVFSDAAPFVRSGEELSVSGELKLTRRFTLDGIWPDVVPREASLRVLAQLPDGRVKPLLWLIGYREEFAHPFLLREPMELPTGTIIYGVPEDARLSFVAPARSLERAHRNVEP